MVLNNWYKKEKPFVSGTSTTGGAGGFAVGSSSDGSVIFDFTNGSLPSGMYQKSASPTLTWTATGAEFAGDAGSSNSYPLRIASGFTGDYLFQISTRVDAAGSWCSDSSIAVFNTAYDGTNWPWSWGYLSNRISAQNNCKKPYLYGTLSSTNMQSPNSGSVLTDPYLSDGTWVTMHLYHEPSQSRTRYKITIGDKDWEASGTQLGSSPNSGVLELSVSFSGTYYIGIAADNDGASTYVNALRYIAL